MAQETSVKFSFEVSFAGFGRALDNMLAAFKKVAEHLVQESYEDHQMRKWLSQVPHGGIVGNKAVLIVYNEIYPSQSYMLVEDIE